MKKKKKKFSEREGSAAQQQQQQQQQQKTRVQGKKKKKMQQPFSLTGVSSRAALDKARPISVQLMIHHITDALSACKRPLH
ncbi:unnamed protein product [Sphagnum jensenii]|uniref:Uncharacterized protein n=1 Tax=Sphagnum jensenii TaxID=128206 RepID=A0ABP0V717_9BRYO